MEENVSVRIGREELKEINRISSYKEGTKSSVLREVLRLGIKQKMLEIALERFQRNEATAAKAAKVAGISLSEFLEVMHQRGINYHYAVEDLRDDFESIMEYDK